MGMGEPLMNYKNVSGSNRQDNFGRRLRDGVQAHHSFNIWSPEDD